MAAGSITKIERQQKNRHRYSIFLDGEFAFGIGEDILHSRHLINGQILTEQDVADLLVEDERKLAKMQAFRYLTVRDHSETELAGKLRQKGFSATTIQWVLADLRRLHFLNDTEFAALFARNRLAQRPIGRRQLEYELKQKGISSALLTETLDKIYSETNEETLVRQLAAKRLLILKGQPPLKVRKKLADFLLRRGFEWEVVKQVLAELIVAGEDNGYFG